MLTSQVRFTIRSASGDVPPLEIVAEGGTPTIFGIISGLVVIASATVPALWLAWLDTKEKVPVSLRDEARKVIDKVAERDKNGARVESARRLLAQWPVEHDEEKIKSLLEELLAAIDY